MSVAPEQNAKVIEPGYNPLKLYTVDEENRERRFILSYVIEKCVL